MEETSYLLGAAQVVRDRAAGWWHVMNRLAVEAAPATATAEIVHQIRTGTAP
jgi:hypothetical protein